ncbi:beta-eliminating lyase-related protein [Tsuneonella sp. YG55]|uniref:Beta-eliminating lyase-related protein n=1 Tax=Tsuneonella litorea TaxID=2976475 RepID=A0A9X2W468_9SPHN|nr:beta-eliminating lyase-related protein [Tsuneonella litorea]MCT2559914.1 beta-eliminating lyase-related protein [Tsuneonella litorea]
MTSSDDREAERARLKRASRHLFGAGPRDPADEFEAIAAWLRAHDVLPDTYGAGPLVEEFEREVADLFGMEAARFMPSGCMAQPIALRVWSDRAGVPVTAFHPTSHLELHEEHGYRELHGLAAHLLGDVDRPTTADDLAALVGPGGAAHGSGLASLLVELPLREIGGQLPSWDELVALCTPARAKGIRLHLDGARVWQAAPAYGRSLAEIAALFDSVYVSFYKDVGALPGAMLLGPRDFIDEAAVWQRRQGGTLYTAMANVVSARLHLGECLERMPRLVERAREVAALFTAHPRATVTPDPPQTSMFHLRIEGDAETLLAARDEAARRTGIWLTTTLKPVPGERAATTELAMGVSSLAIGDAELAEAIAILLAD